MYDFVHMSNKSRKSIIIGFAVLLGIFLTVAIAATLFYCFKLKQKKHRGSLLDGSIVSDEDASYDKLRQ